MSFNSYLFVLLFFPIVVIGYHMLNLKGHFTFGKWLLLVASLLFYGYAGRRGLLTVVLLIVVNYGIYILIQKRNSEKVFLIIGIILDVFSLFVFKYFVACEIKLNQVIGTHFTFNNIIVPLGISFITFSQISFLVDAYREKERQDGNVLTNVSLADYSLYVLFFPKVTVGPIALAGEFIPQFNDSIRKNVDWNNISKGLFAFTLGLAKKVLLADVLAKYADWGFLNITGLGTTNALIVMIAYTLQIYFDFSGFCDMAMGICIMLNFDLPLNFNSPYRALSVGEFWDRWHITLTKFFTKYVYIPLGGNRKGNVRTYINIIIVFLVSGIWHGAAFTFVIWGIMHGIASCVERAFKNVGEKIPKAIKWISTFLFVNVAWVFFRASTLTDAIEFIKELVSFKFPEVSMPMVVASMPEEYEIFWWIFKELGLNVYYTGLPITILVLLFALFASTKMKNTSERLVEFKVSNRMVAITVVLLVWSIISLSEVSSFIYVNF